jgi:hypothetical protein
MATLFPSRRAAQEDHELTPLHSDMRQADRRRNRDTQPEVSQAIKIGEKDAFFATKSCCSISRASARA